MATYWENSCSFGLRYVSWYKYLIVSLVFSHLGFWSGNLFLIAPFPDLCLLVPFFTRIGIDDILFSLSWSYPTYSYYYMMLMPNVARGLDSVMDNALACHRCGPGSNPGQGM